MKTLHDVANYEGTTKPNTGSREASHVTVEGLTPEMVAKLPMDDVLTLATKASSKFSEIHASIIEFYKQHGSVSPNQLDTMRAFVSSNADMIVNTTRTEVEQMDAA